DGFWIVLVIDNLWKAGRFHAHSPNAHGSRMTTKARVRQPACSSPLIGFSVSCSPQESSGSFFTALSAADDRIVVRKPGVASMKCLKSGRTLRDQSEASRYGPGRGESS